MKADITFIHTHCSSLSQLVPSCSCYSTVHVACDCTRELTVCLLTSSRSHLLQSIGDLAIYTTNLLYLVLLLPRTPTSTSAHQSQIASMVTDIDMDIDMEIDPEVARMQAEAEAINARAQQHAQEAAQNDAMNGIEQAPEEGEVDPNAIMPFKVHLRGLDDLTTRKIEEGVREVYNTDLYRRLQWIDDTSANLVFDTEDAAADALAALSAEDENEPLKLRAVKLLESLGGAQLQARMAIEADVKAPGAKDRSRFYLMNPDYDPDSRPRKRKNIRDHGPRIKRTRQFSEDELSHRRGSVQSVPFNVEFYDDAPSGPDAAARPVSHSSASSYDTKKKTREGGDLFANRDNGRLRSDHIRDRSASPDRDGDGRYGFSEEQPYRRTARHRSATPPRLRRNRENQDARLERSKELFPSRGATTSSLKANGRAPEAPRSKPSHAHNGNGNANANEPADLFPDRTINGSRELFPDKAQHRRQEARDINVDEVATAIGQYNLDGTCDVCDTYHYSSPFPGPSRAGRKSKSNETTNTGRDLFARVTGGPQSNSSNGRLRSDGNTSSSKDQGFSFKGAGKAEPGFSILGASESNNNRERGANLAKELFPHRAGTSGGDNNGRSDAPNGGRDLFDGRIKGRARKRAEDLF